MSDENHDDEVLTPELEAKVLERFKPLKENVAEPRWSAPHFMTNSQLSTLGQ